MLCGVGFTWPVVKAMLWLHLLFRTVRATNVRCFWMTKMTFGGKLWWGSNGSCSAWPPLKVMDSWVRQLGF